MNIIFDKEYLHDLFFKGNTTDKKHRFQPEVIRGYQKAVTALASANCIEDLFPYKSLNYEALSGNKNGINSVRCNRKYRLEFIVNEEGCEPIIKICRLLDITNHYK